MPTDTLYGIVGSALKKDAVKRIYALRKRKPGKPMIILIGDVNDVKEFGIVLDGKTKKMLAKLWPGKVSVVLPLARTRAATIKKFRYLHRGTNTLAFRLPKPPHLRMFLRKTGPLVAPSANPEGKPPALTIRAAQKHFGSESSFYLDVGRLVSKPSTLVAIEGKKLIVLRKGAVRVAPAQ
jgi:L-threonylcarbamoyladenylate synthase